MRSRRDWNPYKRRVPLDAIQRALSDRTLTCREVAAQLGYSAKWMANMSVQLGIARPRGGDRRSPAARARYGG